MSSFSFLATSTAQRLPLFSDEFPATSCSAREQHSLPTLYSGKFLLLSLPSVRIRVVTDHACMYISQLILPELFWNW